MFPGLSWAMKSEAVEEAVQLDAYELFQYNKQLSCFITMQPSSKMKEHKERMLKMRQSLKSSPLITKTTLALEVKIEKIKLRRQSVSLDMPMLDKNLANSESEGEEEDTSDFNERYTMGEKIGEGAHGVVKKCYCKSSGDLLAVKTMVLDQQHLLYLRQNFIDIKRLKHPHILSYKAIFFEMAHEKCHLVMDYLPFPDLLSTKIKTEKELKEIAYQITETLGYIHSQKICHRDIKPENILYNEEERKIIIVDFGISRKLVKRGIAREMLTVTGTPYYRAPEMFEGGGYNELVDMWALGVTVFKLMAGLTPFESEYHSDTINNIMKAELIFPASIEARFSKQARMFVARLLKRRNERITSKEALKDLWFIDIQQENYEYMRSMTMNRRKELLHTNLEASCNPPELTRTITMSQRGQTQLTGKSKQEVLNSLKSLKDVEEEESMIYGFDEDEGHTPTKSPTKV